MGVSSRSLAAGSAVIKLSLLGGPVDKQLKSLENRMRSFGSKMSALGTMGVAAGGAIVGAFAAATKAFIGSGDALNDMATRTGFTVATLSALEFAADQSGTSLEAVEKASRGMARNLLAASNGSEAANQALSALGLTLEQLRALSPSEQFLLISDRLSKIEAPGMRAALAMKVFGKSGADLIPLLKDGKDGITALIAEAQSLGVVMSQKDATAAAALDDALRKAWFQVKTLAREVGAAIAGPLTDWLTNQKDNLLAAINWTKANGELILKVAKLAAIFTAASTAVLVLGRAFTVLSVAIGTVRIAVILLTAHPFVALATAISALVLLVAKWTGLLDKLLSQLGLITGHAADSTAEVNKLAAAINNAANAQAGFDVNKEKLKAEIAANNAQFGNPWGIDFSKPNAVGMSRGSRPQPAPAKLPPLPPWLRMVTDKLGVTEAAKLSPEVQKLFEDAGRKLAAVQNAAANALGGAAAALVGNPAAAQEQMRVQQNQPQGTFDTQFARQMFGGARSNEEIDLFKQIAKHTGQMAKRRPVGGVQVGP